MKKILFLILTYTLMGQTVAFTQDAKETQKANEILKNKQIENIDKNGLIKSEITEKEELELMKNTLTSEEYDVWKAEKYAAKNNSPKLK
jgi:hypothetical protein